MTQERVQTTLRFVGDWPWWAGAIAAFVLGLIAWLMYRREVRGLRLSLRWLLPALRTLAIVMLVFMLSGPVLHHRKTLGQLSRLMLFVDVSKSMDLTDASMDIGRKLRILQRAGMLPADAVRMELALASETLNEAQAVVENSRLADAEDPADPKAAAEAVAAKLAAARGLLQNAAPEADRLERFDRDLLNPARELAKRDHTQINDRTRTAQDLASLASLSARWEAELTAAFEKETQELVAVENSAIQAALRRFDNLPRWQRVQAMLLEGEQRQMLAHFAKHYDVQLIALDGSEAKRIWQPTQRDSSLPEGLPKPESEFTNLATGLKSGVGEGGAEQRGAVVLFSDGQHNEGSSPVEVAQIFGGRGMPLYTVGLGSHKRPADLALVKIDAPESVFHQDRVRGEITLKDDMPAGQAFTVTIRDGDKVVWEQALATENKQLRKVPFDFSVAELVAGRSTAPQAGGVQVSGIPLELQVSVSTVEGDREPGNNDGSLRMRAVTQKRKILVLDGRPRWETRYVRNLFERDEQWELNTVLAGPGTPVKSLPRGEKPGSFPTTSAELATYDLIIFGEMPAALFQGTELQWMHDFVAHRGGAIHFIDGARGWLKEYGDTALGPLFPVEWKGQPIREGIARISVPERSLGLAPFTLAADRAQNVETWSHLRPPHWISGATPLPGSETLLEAEIGAERKAALAVYRPYGAGRVLYHAFDDSWRWRYEVADQHHVKFWNQMANWIAELPFAVRDRLLSLDAGAITYQPGDSADLRVRLRDGEGKPVTNAVVEAVLYRDGEKVATVQLTPEDNEGGLFRGRTAALEPGEYEVGVQSPALPESELKARTEFKVMPRETGELTQLHLNEDLLRQMAAAAGGAYLREENIDRLPALLAPLSEGKVIESETVLWQSYWWFLPLIGLLTIEWIIRKRVGLL